MKKPSLLLAHWPRMLRAVISDHPRSFIYAVVLGLVVGMTGLFLPVEELLLNLRSSAIRHQASGDIVIVGLDDKSFDHLGGAPIPRRHYATIIDELARKGANKIVFDLTFQPNDDADDIAFGAAIARHKDKVYLIAGRTNDNINKQRQEILPPARIRQGTTVADADFFVNTFGVTRQLPYASIFEDKMVPSVSGLLAGTPLRFGTFPVDYSLAPDSVPQISAIDVIEGRIAAKNVIGKQVIIADVTRESGDLKRYPSKGAGLTPGVFIHIAGAETLKRGMPIDMGWLPTWIIGVLSAWWAMRASRLLVLAQRVFASLSLILLLTLALDRLLIFTAEGAALATILVATIAATRNLRRATLEQRTMTHPVSGYSNFIALRQKHGLSTGNVVVAKIHNFFEIYALLESSHEAELIEQIARRLSLGVGVAELFQGDDGLFAWVYNDEKSAIDADVLDALFMLFRNPIKIAGRPLDLIVTFGIDRDHKRPMVNRLAGAITAAEEASKESLRWKFATAVNAGDREWRLSLLGQLDAAIDAGQVWVAYQPKYDLAAGRFSGAEALVRWSHPERGDIPPGDFIPLAEEHDRIGKLTDFVLRSSVQAALDLSRIDPDFSVAVNISPRLLQQSDFARSVENILHRTQLDPRNLILEITETASLTTDATVQKILNDLQRLEIGISIDDYGTGFSTLAYLKTIPAKEIKIDRNFIGLIEHSQSDRLMVHSTIQLAHALKRRVVAEGVESEAQMELLEEMGCDQVQGYLTGKPMQLSELKNLINPLARKAHERS